MPSSHSLFDWNGFVNRRTKVPRGLKSLRWLHSLLVQLIERLIGSEEVASLTLAGRSILAHSYSVIITVSYSVDKS